MSLLGEMWDDGWPGRLLLGLLVTVLVGICWVTWWVIADARAWSKYKAEHHCVYIRPGETRTWMQCHTIGKVTTCTPYTRTDAIYVCDGGEEVVR